ncbi:MAG TPA: hypothetical protein PK467_00575 [Candidatus Wallbacteria bacterium]|nr:hypothetical protein [Candidatus Wallbacteria bacterium]
MSFVIAAKCAPDAGILSNIQKAGIKAVEIFLSKQLLTKRSVLIDVCKDYDFRYAVHAPNDDFSPDALAEFVYGTNAEAVTFHDIFWEDEWLMIIERLKNLQVKLCVENLGSVHDSAKFMRRFGFGRCLDVEHLQIEVAGVNEAEFVNAMREATHIHLTGYSFGTRNWHTHIYQNYEHGIYMLDLIKKSGYNGLVVSEAGCSFQTFADFQKLSRFYEEWLIKNGGCD